MEVTFHNFIYFCRPADRPVHVVGMCWVEVILWFLFCSVFNVSDKTLLYKRFSVSATYLLFSLSDSWTPADWPWFHKQNLWKHTFLFFIVFHVVADPRPHCASREKRFGWWMLVLVDRCCRWPCLLKTFNASVRSCLKFLWRSPPWTMSLWKNGKCRVFTVIWVACPLHVSMIINDNDDGDASPEGWEFLFIYVWIVEGANMSQVFLKCLLCLVCVVSIDKFPDVDSHHLNWQIWSGGISYQKKSW